MSKELEYEFNNFANLLNKDCMNLMELLKKQDKDNKPILYLGKHFKKVILPYEEYQKMCNRLEAIDNANPSEALNGLEFICKILNEKRIDVKWLFKNEYTTIKQALLKAQEPKKYLKWEDLEFKDYEQEISVLLNGNKYSVKYTLLPDDDFYMVWIYKENKCIFSLDGKYLENKQFFNDLHLERVLE